MTPIKILSYVAIAVGFVTLMAYPAHSFLAELINPILGVFSFSKMNPVPVPGENVIGGGLIILGVIMLVMEKPEIKD